MLRSQNPLRWLMLAWLALAPALSAAHAADHDLDQSSAEVSCVLCQIGERDDDIFAPGHDYLPASPHANENEEPVRQQVMAHAVRARSIRAPPSAH